jgi:HK97 family phage portal protein
MAIVQSFGAFQSYNNQPPGGPTYYDSWRGCRVYERACFATYAEIYRRQPNVRTVIDYIARNIAQLPIHVFRRVSDTDRVRLYDHPLAQWLWNPNPATTQYRLIESFVLDICIYWMACWLKVRMPAGRIGLVRIPPQDLEVIGWLMPKTFVWITPDGQRTPLDPSEIVYVTGFDPCDPVLGISPLETLRRTLAEEAAASVYRESYWVNAARLEGVIERPATAPKWSADQKQSFRDQWQSRFAGPRNAGQTAVLEDGMQFKATSFSPKDSEYIAARKLTREECAAAYHVPLPMVGILDHATFSNVKEQHKQLYQDTLGPWLEWLQEEIERQLLIEATDTDHVYVEFNLADKLKGSFEEQAAGLQALVGRPIMTANEGRARLNLPAITDDPTADELALPLNTSTGPATALPEQAAESAAVTPVVPLAAQATLIERTWDRQRQRVAKLPPGERAVAFDVARWDRELAEDLEPLYRAAGYAPEEATRASATVARTVNADTLQLLVAREDAWSPAREAALYAG